MKVVRLCKLLTERLPLLGDHRRPSTILATTNWWLHNVCFGVFVTSLFVISLSISVNAIAVSGRALVTSAVSTTALFSPALPARCPSPPCICHVDQLERKHVTCANAGMNAIPIQKMDWKTQILNVTAPIGSHNSISMGRIFFNLTQLQEIHITRSRLPAIGRSTFCPVNSCSVQSCNSTVRLLNLSENNLQILREDDFNCLSYLEVLDLAENQLQEVPSAVFRQLPALLKLSLASNKFTQLAPLMFYGLSELRELDLSRNPLTRIGNDVLNNVPRIQRLILFDCQLTKIDSDAFSALPNLELLDLSNNRLKHFNVNIFASLKQLRILLLKGNSITVLADNIFNGLYLELLDLSRNLINPLTSCTFCGAKIKKLDLSNNKLTSLALTLLEPIAISLEFLVLDSNYHLIDPPSSLVALLQPVRRLRHLSIADMKLNETLPESAFDALRYLTYLNMSKNSFRELSGRLISNLPNLDTLDVSENELTFLDPSALQMITRMKYLQRVFFQRNPFSCYRCHILPFIDWLNSDPSPYWNVCGRLTNDPLRLAHCGQCFSPASLSGRYLHEAGLNRELEWCTNPEVQLRLTASEPQVGLILAFLIILSLIAVILVVVAIYRKHGAVYYTQEDKFASSEKIYTGGVSHNIGWTHAGADGRMVSQSSTQYTMSRQNTMFSPQSSLDQTHLPAGVTNGANHNHTPQSVGVCDSCANSTAVKQVIASIPTMTEMLEQSLNNATNGGTIMKPINGGKSPTSQHPQIPLSTKTKPIGGTNGSNGILVRKATITTAETEATQTDDFPVESIGVQTVDQRPLSLSDEATSTQDDQLNKSSTVKSLIDIAENSQPLITESGEVQIYI